MASSTVAAPNSALARHVRRYVPGWVGWLAACGLLFLIPYLTALALASYGPYHSNLQAFGTAVLDVRWRNISEWVAAAGCVAIGVLAPEFLSKPLRWLEQAVSRFASHRTQAIVFVALLPMIVRLALLPVLGIPEPLVADEFGYLLLADTFASGRLTNPTHPFWKHFETVYVFHQPSYSSIYPIAPALLLTAAKLVGANPWFGVWLEAGLLSGLIVWMLQAWVPPKWAFLGGLLAVGRFTVISPWMNSYWGGATAAIGGALVIGALPRILRRQRVRDSLWLGLGLAILAQSRPYEGMLFAIPIVAYLGYWILKEKLVRFRVRFTRVALPLTAVIIAMAAGVMWYNSRVTGSALLPPYLLHQRIYGTPQTLYWQAPIPDAPGVHHYRDIADVFKWQLAAHEARFSWWAEGVRLGAFWQFYLQPLLTLPLLLLPLVLRDTRLRVLLISAVALLSGNAMYPFFFPHYAAPLCGLLILFIVYGMRYLRMLRFRSRPAGAAMFRWLFVTIAAGVTLSAMGGLAQPWHVTATLTPRAQVLNQLRDRGGKHLVLVRYGPHHPFHYGVVFNDADIDHSQVVWAHQTDPASDKALANYYSDRDVWLFNPDETPVTLIPFTDKPYISAVVAGAGRRDDPNEGVSPGSIAILLGANFAHGFQGATSLGPLKGLPLRLVSISAEFGTVFAPGTLKPAAPLPAPRSAPEVTVQFGSIPAPVLAVSNLEGQEAVTIQVPFEVPVGEATVTLRGQGMVSRKKVRILPATPGVFQMRMRDGVVRGIVMHSDGSLVDLRHPAHPGETLRMFATGLGPMLPAIHTNQRVAGGRAPEPLQRLIIGVNHRGAPLVSAQYSESLAGVEEITFQIPPDVPASTDVPLSVGVVMGGRTVYSNKSRLPVR